MKTYTTLCLALAVLLTGCAQSSPAPAAGGITVTDAWVRYSPGAEAMGAAYFVVHNGGGSDDSLQSVIADVAGMAGMHQTTESNGTMQMSPVDSVAVPAGGQVEFKPGGYHVMLMGLTHELKAGDKVTLTLKFKNAGTVSVQCEVKDQ